ncbi:MAG: hypothetical protein Q9209_002425 [Squamulea sp. 1 TL-2023]
MSIPAYSSRPAASSYTHAESDSTARNKSTNRVSGDVLPLAPLVAIPAVVAGGEAPPVLPPVDELVSDPDPDPAPENDPPDESVTQRFRSVSDTSGLQASHTIMPQPTMVCSSCVTCPSLSFNLSLASIGENDDDFLEDRMGKRSTPKGAVLEKRWIWEHRSRLGGCPVRTYTRKPKYPGPHDVTSWESNPAGNPSMVPFYHHAAYWAVPTDLPNCLGPDWQFRNTKAVQIPQVPGGRSWQIGGNAVNSVNIDHAYEVKLLDDFFDSRINGAFDCSDVTTLFDAYDYTNYDPADPASLETRLNRIYSQLASYRFADFLGMAQRLNSLKGNLWLRPATTQPFGLQGMPVVYKKQHAKEALAEISVIMNMVNDPVIRPLFQATNERVYKAFAGIDKLIHQEANRGCPIRDHNASPMRPTWASAYSVWMTDKISLQNLLIRATASVYSADVPTVAGVSARPAEIAEIEGWSSWMSNYNQRYQIDQLTFPAIPNWPQGHLPIMKRDSAVNASCMAAFPIPTKSAMPSVEPGSAGRSKVGEPTKSSWGYPKTHPVTTPALTTPASVTPTTERDGWVRNELCMIEPKRCEGWG